MKFLDFLQSLPLPGLLAATVFLGLVLSWAIVGLVRFSVRLSGFDPAKPLPIHDLVPVTSILFALMVAFSASGIWNDWQQARSAVQREALALENVLALAEGLSSERTAKVKESVIAYAKAAAEHEWPAMARQADTDDPLYAVSDRILVSLIAELSREAVTTGTSPISAMLLPQIFEARGARLARLTLAHSGLSGVQWSALIALIVSALVVAALVHNNQAGIQVLAMSLYSVAAATTFFVILAHDRPFIGVISVSPRPLLQVAAKANAGIPRAIGSQLEAR
jgi:uncharacterized protein DUF4239